MTVRLKAGIKIPPFYVEVEYEKDRKKSIPVRFRTKTKEPSLVRRLLYVDPKPPSAPKRLRA